MIFSMRMISGPDWIKMGKIHGLGLITVFIVLFFLIVFLYKHREDNRYAICHKQNEKRTVKQKSEKEKYKNILVRPKTKH